MQRINKTIVRRGQFVADASKSLKAKGSVLGVVAGVCVALALSPHPAQAQCGFVIDVRDMAAWQQAKGDVTGCAGATPGVRFVPNRITGTYWWVAEVEGRTIVGSSQAVQIGRALTYTDNLRNVSAGFVQIKERTNRESIKASLGRQFDPDSADSVKVHFRVRHEVVGREPPHVDAENDAAYVPGDCATVIGFSHLWFRPIRHPSGRLRSFVWDIVTQAQTVMADPGMQADGWALRSFNLVAVVDYFWPGGQWQTSGERAWFSMSFDPPIGRYDVPHDPELFWPGYRDGSLIFRMGWRSPLPEWRAFATSESTFVLAKRGQPDLHCRLSQDIRLPVAYPDERSERPRLEFIFP